MDIEDEGWVNIPYDGLLEVHDDPNNLFKLDCFNSSQKSQEFVDSSMITFPIQMDDHQVVDDRKEVTKLASEADLDPIFQVFFKKENEFVEMKMDSPRSNSWRSVLPCIETDMVQYKDKNEDHLFNGSSPTKDVNDDEVNKVIKEEGNEGLNIWKKGLNGIGVFCSLGMAAATICIILFGNGHRHKQNQNLRIQLYADDKRINQVVHHANEAMSATHPISHMEATMKASRLHLASFYLQTIILSSKYAPFELSDSTLIINQNPVFFKNPFDIQTTNNNNRENVRCSRNKFFLMKGTN